MLSLKSLFHFFISVQYLSKTISAEKSYGFNLVEDDTAPIGIPDYSLQPHLTSLGRVISFVNFENNFENDLILLR
jgi:hypothetical protein